MSRELKITAGQQRGVQEVEAVFFCAERGELEIVRGTHSSSLGTTVRETLKSLGYAEARGTV